MAELIIGDDSHIPPSMMDGTMARGLVPRDLQSFPVGAFAPPSQIQLVDLTTLPDRIRESEATKSRLSDIRMRGNNGAMIPSLDQNDPRYFNTNSPRWGYCWAHGPVAADVILRAKMNQPYVPLSAFGLAYTFMKGKDEGWFGAGALDILIQRGVGPESLWPRFEQKMRTPDDQFWVEAAKYKITDGWMELESSVFDRDMSYHQVLSCLIDRIPVPADLMWWGHHVCFLDVVDSFPNKDPKDLNRYGVRFWNSWGDQYGTNGMGVLTGSKARPDNAVAPAVTTAS